MTNTFVNFGDSPSAPATHGLPITPNDTTDLVAIPKAVFVGGGGTIVMIGLNASDTAVGVSYTVPSGYIFPLRARRILATGTTATNIVALY